MLFQGPLYDFRIVPVVRVCNVKTQEPEVAGQFPQVDIQDKGGYGDGSPILSLHSYGKVYPD